MIVGRALYYVNLLTGNRGEGRVAREVDSGRWFVVSEPNYRLHPSAVIHPASSIFNPNPLPLISEPETFTPIP
ncbi:MAG TPA: hypothetical protein VIH42_11870 [Thermoguttaceae bacterium]